MHSVSHPTGRGPKVALPRQLVFPTDETYKTQ